MSESKPSSNDTAAVAFLIDSPMQAWGSSSRFQNRETEAFPTKSALLGLVAAALGIDKHGEDEGERLAEIANLRATVCALPRAGKAETLRLTDFHTIGGGYDRKGSDVDRLSIPRKASGPPFGTVITRRTYLTDARFTASLEGSNLLIHQIADALTDPLWGVWFGRKTCLPALPLAPTIGKNSKAAFESLLARVAEWDGRDLYELHALERWDEPDEGDPSEGDFHMSDSPVSFGDRIFTTRPVRHHRPLPGHESPS